MSTWLVQPCGPCSQSVPELVLASQVAAPHGVQPFLRGYTLLVAEFIHALVWITLVHFPLVVLGASILECADVASGLLQARLPPGRQPAQRCPRHVHCFLLFSRIPNYLIGSE